MLVFQYGSNASLGRLNSPGRLNGSARPLAAATTVEGHALVFNVWSKCNKCGAASITREGDTPVWGRLYDIPDDLVDREKKRAGRRTLDEIEGEGTNYTRTRIAVVRPDTGQRLTALDPVRQITGDHVLLGSVKVEP